MYVCNVSLYVCTYVCIYRGMAVWFMHACLHARMHVTDYKIDAYSYNVHYNFSITALTNGIGASFWRVISLVWG